MKTQITLTVTNKIHFIPKYGTQIKLFKTKKEIVFIWLCFVIFAQIHKRNEKKFK